MVEALTCSAVGAGGAAAGGGGAAVVPVAMWLPIRPPITPAVSTATTATPMTAAMLPPLRFRGAGAG
ncbi:hypothetical protein [Mycobacterium szulgai]|uniref:hypothetical protein n=1 Tax=Mycobacterium szulgai TaxID=1787 RepID=UPI00111C32E7|nr:hypothetical protein [Mycobacterium szulgai]MCV7075686.1 hypothetical protein [Mycobacterium szulgai]